MTERRCAACGELFGHTRSDAAYCSAACRQRAYRQRSTGRPRPVDTPIAELARIADELERHGMYNGMVPAWGRLRRWRSATGLTTTSTPFCCG